MSSLPFIPTSQVVKLQSKMNRLKDLFTPTQSSTHLPGTTSSAGEDGRREPFTTAKSATTLFPVTTAEVDGEECLHDCDSCTVSLPRKWEIDESDKLYGHVKGWDYHVIVGTGKSDWVRDVIDEKGSLMEGLGVHGLEIQPKSTNSIESSGGNKRKRVMLSASNMPTGGDSDYENNGKTNAIVLPAWKYIEGVSKSEVDWFMNDVVGAGPSNLDHLEKSSPSPPAQSNELPTQTTNAATTNGTTPDPTSLNTSHPLNPEATVTKSAPASTIPPHITVKPLHHKALILMCSHKTRDARCGQSAPLLKRELERHLRPLGLYRDLHDDRPGGVGIYFINHVGGHKYSANVMIYRRTGAGAGAGTSSLSDGEETDSAVQGIWLARVRPEDCENIVRYTVLQGKVVKPERQLRGGFDRSVGLASW